MEHPSGHIGIATGFLGRYREFDYCMARTETPQGSSYQYYMSVDVCQNFNLMVRHLIKNPRFQWLWILGDDHLWDANLLLRLLDRQVDAIVPLCCRRLSPYYPILHTSLEKGCVGIEDPWTELKGKTGLFEWKGTTGNAGLLVRRHVFEAMTDPYFENGQNAKGVGASDLHFWHKLLAHGFKPVIDLDNIIGHITHTSVWPEYDEKTGEWKAIMRSP
jgi:hypothetical protein